jgi:hypothetical protein
VTSAPRRFHTLPSSRPITPAPITPRRFGTSVKSSAPALSTMCLAVELRERQLDRHRAGSEDHVGRADRLLGPSAPVISTSLPLSNLPLPKNERDLVRLEQLRHAAGELLDDLVLAADEGRHVDARVVGTDAVHVEVVREVVELLGRIEQRLGRDATDVEAGAAECLPCRPCR